MSRVGIVHGAYPGDTPKQARDARARAWRYVFDCYEAKKKAGVPSTGNDGKEIENAPANLILPPRE